MGFKEIESCTTLLMQYGSGNECPPCTVTGGTTVGGGVGGKAVDGRTFELFAVGKCQSSPRWPEGQGPCIGTLNKLLNDHDSGIEVF